MPRQPMTAAEIARDLNMQEDTARKLVDFLRAAGIAEDRGARKTPGKSGRAPNVYFIPDDMPAAVTALLKRW